MVTSDKSYENDERSSGYRETDRLGGRDLYSASKAGAEIFLSTYIRCFFNNRSKQRIGIARALYKKADVIIFDEATSSLDNDTENAVMDAIDALGGEITVLIIAHRLTTLKKCTNIVEVSDGGILRTGSYQEIINQLI